MNKQKLIAEISMLETFNDGESDLKDEIIGIITKHLDGYVIVLEEPNHKMLIAGNAVLPSCVNSDGVYKAMIKASQESSDDK